MRRVRLLGDAMFGAWTAACLANIFLWPLNRLEWMLGEGNPELTFCTLPIDTESPTYAAAWGAVPVVLLIGIATWRWQLRRSPRTSVLLAGIVSFAWLARFVLLPPHC